MTNQPTHAERIRRWLCKAVSQQLRARLTLELAFTGSLSAREWRAVAARCRDAQRLLAKAKWQAEANALRARRRT